MFGRPKNRNARAPQSVGGSFIESLESRRLLSAAAGVFLHSDAKFLHPFATGSSSVQGYSPSQIRHAYGFDQVSFGASALPADGRGQTIAIVDAYNDPNISGDLSVFDNQFGLGAPASLRVVDQNGGGELPTTDSGWAGEIALDVEWAHAVAPQANILLVEANSSSLTDLMTAVDYARHAAGVSVVSMSWGGSEFFSWNGTEFTGQTQYDPIFTTPAGHQGVTFVAAAGDSGSFSGVQWPASSTNVLSVGGTSLTVQDQSGTYYTESSWSGTSGGYSQIEPQPSWQSAVQNSGARSTPDVSYDGDPNTGFAVYDSVPDQGFSGWEEVGGTSAGAPQWAALVAIANDGRTLAGHGTLDGATQTLPILYSLYSDPNSSGYSTYASYFNDVVDGGAGSWHWRWGWGFSGSGATAGYDTATGLGTPHAAQVVQALLGTAPSSSGSNSSGGSTNPGGSVASTPAQLPASPIVGTFTNSPHATAIGGTMGSLKLRLTNTGDARFTGPLSITLYASTDNALSADDTAIGTIAIPQINLRAGGSKTITVKFDYPTDLANGSYFIIASIDATGTGTAPADAATASTVSISAPMVDLAAAFAASQAVLVNPGHDTTVAMTIQNLGNVTASGTVDLILYASNGQTLDSSAQLLASMTGRKINLRPGHSMTVHIHFVAPAGQQGGTYNLLAGITSSTNPADTNPDNDLAVIGTRS